MYIPKPCHEDWSKMTPVQHGRACSSCNAVVLDMTRLSNAEISDLIKNTGGKCGRFYEDQLIRPEPQKGWLMQWLGSTKKDWLMISILTLLEITVPETASATIQYTEQIIPERKLSPLDSGAALPDCIQGRVTDQYARPDANRQVYVYTLSGKPLGITTTDDKGLFTFALPGTLTGDKYCLKLRHVKEKGWAYFFHGHKTKVIVNKGEWTEVKTKYTKRKRIFKNRKVVRMGYF